ncbi:class I SAM-dependent methyltransferase [Microbacterium terregens]|uniref:Class I SAM-dependent methyltransferase n=1 Tax=Microbacterium terregens TaxID=69363 RepID=A0ABV5T0B5_9MICO
MNSRRSSGCGEERSAHRIGTRTSRTSKASAEHLPLAAERYDLVTAQLVVHFMTDPLAGVGEMRRVARPGGVIAVSVWDFAGARAPQSAFFGALRAVVPDADDEVDRAGARRGELSGLLEQAGCRDIEQTELTVTVTSPTFEDWWEPYTLGVGPAGVQLTALTTDRRQAVRDRCRARLGSGPIRTTATAWAAKGLR